jgi:potassium-dependent mechanosensitive channel
LLRISRRKPWFLLIFWITLMASWCLLAAPLAAQENKALAPESLSRVLAEGAATLEKDIAAVKAEANATQQQVKQAEENLQQLRTQVANLKASQAVGDLQLKVAQEALAGFSQREGQVAAQFKEVEEKRQQLAKEADDRQKAFAGLQQQVERLKASKHPTWTSPKFRKAWEQRQNLAKQYQAAASQFLERRDEVLRVLEQERQVLSDVVGELKTYVEVGWKEELLKRQTPASLWEIAKKTWESLLEVPERITGYLADPLLPKRVATTLKANWAPSLGLLALFLILAKTAPQVRRWAVPYLRLWQTESVDLGPKVIFTAGEIIVTHLFALSFGAWLALMIWTLGWWQTRVAKLLLLGVFVWLGLRLGLKLVQALFAGKEQGGIFPLDERTARFYRTHLKLLLVYVLVFGVFGLTLLRRLGIEAASCDMLGEILQVGFMVWVLWLLRRQHFEALRAELPGPTWVKGRGFFVALRLLLFVVLGATVITGLLGFHNLSASIAEGATLIGAVVVLFWVLWQSARAVLEQALRHRNGRVTKKVRKQEELLKQYYLALMKLGVTILVAGVVLFGLNLWGIPLSSVVWFLQGLGWGPRLGPFHLSLANLGLAVLTLYVGRWLSRFLRTFLEARFYHRANWDESLRYTISSTLHYSIQAVAILTALGYLGVSFGDVAIVAGGLGVGIGFGLQNIVNNFVSGLILLFERPIKVGDMLVIDGQWGLVKEIRVRSTIFQTFDRSVLIIPNSDLISNKILNWTHYGPGVNRIAIKVGVSYDSDPHQVTSLLDEICRANPRVLPEPPPQITFEAYGDSSLDFNIWVYLNSPSDRIPATHELNSAIFAAFQEAGIEIPFPQRDLHIKSWPGPPGPPPCRLRAPHESGTSPKLSPASRSQFPGRPPGRSPAPGRGRLGPPLLPGAGEAECNPPPSSPAPWPEGHGKRLLFFHRPPPPGQRGAGAGDFRLLPGGGLDAPGGRRRCEPGPSRGRSPKRRRDFGLIPPGLGNIGASANPWGRGFQPGLVFRHPGGDPAVSPGAGMPLLCPSLSSGIFGP